MSRKIFQPWKLITAHMRTSLCIARTQDVASLVIYCHWEGPSGTVQEHEESSSSLQMILLFIARPFLSRLSLQVHIRIYLYRPWGVL